MLCVCVILHFTSFGVTMDVLRGVPWMLYDSTGTVYVFLYALDRGVCAVCA